MSNAENENKYDKSSTNQRMHIPDNHHTKQSNITNRRPHIPDATDTPAPVSTTIDLHSGDSMKRARPTKSVMVLMVEVVPREAFLEPIPEGVDS